MFMYMHLCDCFLPHRMFFFSQNEEGSPQSDQELASMAVAREQDGYIMVDMADIVSLLKWLLFYHSFP